MSVSGLLYIAKCFEKQHGWRLKHSRGLSSRKAVYVLKGMAGAFYMLVKERGKSWCSTVSLLWQPEGREEKHPKLDLYTKAHLTKYKRLFRRGKREENKQNQVWGFVMFAHADVRLLEVKMLVVTLRWLLHKEQVWACDWASDAVVGNNDVPNELSRTGTYPYPCMYALRKTCILVSRHASPFTVIPSKKFTMYSTCLIFIYLFASCLCLFRIKRITLCASMSYNMRFFYRGQC